MTITATQLRADFPEFSDTTKYADATINFWLSVAVITLSESRWGTLLPVGTELFVAHHLVTQALASEDSDVGITPGEVVGPTTAKAVDKVSISMDASAVALEDAGFWNSSLYGIRFMQFARMIGAGGIQLGGC